jgi:hypothetical protein
MNSIYGMCLSHSEAQEAIETSNQSNWEILRKKIRTQKYKILFINIFYWVFKVIICVFFKKQNKNFKNSFLFFDCYFQEKTYNNFQLYFYCNILDTTKKSFHKGKSFQKSSSFSSEKNFHKSSNKKSYRTKNYSIAEEDISQFPVVVGTYSQSAQNDFGFIDVEWLEKGYFVYPKNLNGALDGDSVEVYIKVFNRRKEAVITKIIKRSERILVGTVDLVKDFAFVVLDNPAFKMDVHISNKKLAKYKGSIKSGDKVAIKITKWEWKNPEGSIFEILGDPLAKGVDIMWLALENGARIKFPTW